MQEERNRRTLKSAIRRLPEHPAPAGSWDRLQEQLDRPEEGGRLALDEALEQLPVHAPPGKVWGQLSRRLPRRQHPRRWLAAATIAVLISTGTLSWWLWLTASPEPAMTLSETQPPVDLPDQAVATDTVLPWHQQLEAIHACLATQSERPDSLLAEVEVLGKRLDELAAISAISSQAESARLRYEALLARQKTLLARLELIACQ